MYVHIHADKILMHIKPKVEEPLKGNGGFGKFKLKASSPHKLFCDNVSLEQRYGCSLVYHL